MIKVLISGISLKVYFTAITFVISLVLANKLGVEEYGKYSFVLAIILFSLVPVQFGIPTLIVRETAKSLVHKEFSKLKGLWVWSLKNALVSCILVIIILFIATYLFSFIHNERLLLIALPLIPLIAFISMFSAKTRGLTFVIKGQVVENILLPSLLLLGISYLLYNSKLTSEYVFVVYNLAAFVSCIVAFYIIKRNIPFDFKNCDAEYTSKLWGNSLIPLGLISATNIINRQVDIMLVGFIKGDYHVGLYALASQLSLLVLFMLQVSNSIMSPKFAMYYKQGKQHDLQVLLTQTSRMITAFAAIIFLFIVSLGKVIIEFIYGVEYIQAYLPLCILALGQLISASCGSVGVLLNMSGHERIVLYVVGGSSLGNLILNIVLIPYWGIMGAAISTAVSIACWNIILVVYSHKKLKLNTTVFGGHYART